MLRRTFLQALAAQGRRAPNVIFILADDVGYGDLGCYGSVKTRTPNLDRIAKEGVRFTNAHCSSATCTPTRYSLLTGQYAWRKPGTGILPGDAALIIEPGSVTLPSVMKQAGYRTAAVGKWHLGLGAGNIDWNQEIKPGPREIGFDYSFLIPATGDRTPCVYVENQRVAGLDPADPITVNYKQKVGSDPTGRENPELLKMGLTQGHDSTIVNGISRIGWMSGGHKARWVDEDMGDVITAKAAGFIERSARDPFFLYFATHDVHVPRVPHPRFKGKSACGLRCDALEQLDANVGELLKTLDRLRLTQDTLIMFSSDNGPVLDDGYADRAVADLNGHTPAGRLRGGKYSIHEGGTRMPFVARWPRRIKAGQVSEALISQVDMTHTLAALTGQRIPAAAAPDSFNLLPALLGESRQGRDYLIEHASGGTAIRTSRWKYIPEARNAAEQLYDLAADPGESANLAPAQPAIAADLKSRLEHARNSPVTRQ